MDSFRGGDVHVEGRESNKSGEISANCPQLVMSRNKKCQFKNKQFAESKASPKPLSTFPLLRRISRTFRHGLPHPKSKLKSP